MSIADKISKIIAKADSSTHPEEAEVFMAKAQKLMMEHGLSLLDLGKLDSDDPVGHQDAGHNNNNDPWRWTVGSMLAHYYGCRIIGSRPRGSNNRYWTVFGRESARTTFTLMWPFVDRQVMAKARREHKLGHYKTVSKARTYIGNALAYRLSELIDEQQTEAPKGSGMNALVPVDTIDQLIKEVFSGDVKAGASRALKTDGNAVQVAKEVSLYAQTEAAAEGTKRLEAE